MNKTLLKVYFPYKNDNSRLLPIEIDIINNGDFNKSVKNIRDNFTMFVAQILSENSDLEIETDIEKCHFQKVILEEIDLNAL